MLKGHPLSQINYRNRGALVDMCGRDEELWLNVAMGCKIAMTCTHSRAIDTCCL
jgi:hypothetical protein